MSDFAAACTPPAAVRRAAAAIIDRHGTAALGVAALSASRSLGAGATAEAAFWLCVCDLVRARNRAVKARAGARRRALH